MDKKFLKKVAAVLVGISVLMMLFQFVSAIIYIVTSGELLYLGSKATPVLFVKNASIGLLCALIAVFVSFGFAVFSKNRIFQAIAGGMCIALAVCCLVLVGVSHSDAVKDLSSETYVSYTAYWSELFQLVVASLIVSVYFITSFLCGILAERKQKVENGSTPAEENAPAKEEAKAEVKDENED